MKAVEELLREKNTHLRAVEQETQSLRTKSVHATQAANTLLRRARLKTTVLVNMLRKIALHPSIYRDSLICMRDAFQKGLCIVNLLQCKDDHPQYLTKL